MDNEEHDLGIVLRDADRLGLRYVRDLGHSPDKVWRALTESQHLRHWMPCDLIGERRQGAQLVARFWPDFVTKYGMETPELPASIRVWDPPWVFEWSWDQDILRFELAEIPGGTRMTFTTWLDSATAVPADKTAAGYHACLERLAEVLDHGAPHVALLDAEVAALETRYAALLEGAPGR